MSKHWCTSTRSSLPPEKPCSSCRLPGQAHASLAAATRITYSILRLNPSQPSGDPDLYLKIAPGTSYAGFNACFATFVPEDDADVLGAVQRPLALGSFTTVSGTPAWASIPSWAVIGTQDQAIPPAELTFMAQRAQSKSTNVLAGHLSMITQPRVVADVIREAADATW